MNSLHLLSLITSLNWLPSRSQLLSVLCTPWACTFSKDKITFSESFLSFSSVSFSNSKQLTPVKNKLRGTILPLLYHIKIVSRTSPHTKTNLRKVYFYFSSIYPLFSPSICWFGFFFTTLVVYCDDNAIGGISPCNGLILCSQSMTWISHHTDYNHYFLKWTNEWW